tara:strand:- start:275 stop:916 length:642 start_codon:yes stop_codon:yes gene_type:complete
MKKVVVVGVGFPDVIRVIDAINEKGEKIEFLGFLDDKKEIQGKTYWGYPVLGTLDWLKDNKDDCFVVSSVALTTRIRKKAHERIISFGAKFTSLIHPDVDMRYNKCGEGVIICNGAVVAPDAVVGDHVIASFNSVIGHDSIIGDFSFIAAGAIILGHVNIGEGVFLGANSSCYPKIKIGCWSTISMCTPVIRDIPENVSVIGNPGKIIKKDND